MTASLDPSIRDRIDRARMETSGVGSLLRSMSSLMHQSICYPDQAEATLAVCEVALDQMAALLEKAETDLHAAWLATRP